MTIVSWHHFQISTYPDKPSYSAYPKAQQLRLLTQNRARQWDTIGRYSNTDAAEQAIDSYMTAMTDDAIGVNSPDFYILDESTGRLWVFTQQPQCPVVWEEV